MGRSVPTKGSGAQDTAQGSAQDAAQEAAPVATGPGAVQKVKTNAEHHGFNTLRYYFFAHHSHHEVLAPNL